MKITNTPVKNFAKGRQGYKPEAIVLHITEGSASSVMSWFNNPTSFVSSHYLVARNQPHIGKLVSEEDTAWHAGKVTRPTWKGLKKGINPNLYTIGIEVEAIRWYTFPTWTQWIATAWLVKDISKRHNIPLDTLHVIKHNEINANKLCPGRWITPFYIFMLMRFVKRSY